MKTERDLDRRRTFAPAPPGDCSYCSPLGVRPLPKCLRVPIIIFSRLHKGIASQRLLCHTPSLPQVSSHQPLNSTVSISTLLRAPRFCTEYPRLAIPPSHLADARRSSLLSVSRRFPHRHPSLAELLPPLPTDE